MLKSIVLSIATLSFVGACAPITRPVETPIPIRVHGDIDQAREVFVLLPGIRDNLDSFEDRGFVAAGQKALKGREDVAYLAVDAHFGYYRERSLVRRLREEVLGHLAGKKVTAVGISLGGFGALITARRHPNAFDRMVLIAPFLGWPESIEQLKASAGTAPRDDLEAEIFATWRWLADGADGIPTTLLYGHDDGFRPAYDHLAVTAPRISLRGGEGAHDWRAWNSLWADWLAEDDPEPDVIAKVALQTR